jgi:hypothetical protein
VAADDSGDSVVAVDVPVGADAAADTAAASDASVETSGPDTEVATAAADQYFVSWAESAQMLQDPSPFGNSWAEQRTTTLGLVKVTWAGNEGLRWLQPCALHTTTVFGTQTLYSAAFLGAIPVPAVPMTKLGNAWTQSEELVTVGLQEGYTGAMPSLGQKGHPALVDSDKDGLPGATVHINNNLLGKQNLQVAQRQRTQWTATVQPTGELDALPTVTSEQVVVAASMSLLVVQNKTKAVTGKPAETLKWRPLAAAIDCKTLLAEPKKYAGRVWPP